MIEAALLELERGVHDRALLDRVFRSAHSIKGASATLGFADITRLTHALESWLEPLQDGLVELDSDERLGDLLLAATDALKAALFSRPRRSALAGGARRRRGRPRARVAIARADRAGE